MKTKFTPGPWEIDGEFNIRTVDKTNYLRGRGVCTTGSFFSNINGEEVREQNLANASLIAAAPAMFEHIKRALDNRIDDQWLKGAEELLKKARGES